LETIVPAQLALLSFAEPIFCCFYAESLVQTSQGPRSRSGLRLVCADAPKAQSLHQQHSSDAQANFPALLLARTFSKKTHESTATLLAAFDFLHIFLKVTSFN